MGTRANGGALLFTADQFEGEQPDEQQQSPPDNQEQPQPKQPRRDPVEDVEIEIVDEPETEAQPSTQQNTTNEFRYGDDDAVPQVLRGKTASEALGIVNSLTQLAQLNINNQMAQGSGGTQNNQPQEQPLSEIPFDLTEDDLGVGANVDAVKRKILSVMDQFAQAKLQPFQLSQLANASMMARNTAKERLEHWDLFGPEIEQVAGNMPVTQTAQFSTWQAIHDRLVTSNLDKVIDKRQKASNKPAPGFTETKSASNSAPTNAGRKKVQVTRAQADFANALGVPVQGILPYI